jgi:hypothetical protein
VLHEVEHLNVTGPDGLAVARLVDGNGLDPLRLAAFEVANRVEQGGEAGGVRHG